MKFAPLGIAGILGIVGIVSCGRIEPASPRAEEPPVRARAPIDKIVEIRGARLDVSLR